MLLSYKSMNINDTNDTTTNKLLHGGVHRSKYGSNLFELKGQGINRWEPLFFNPQKNSIEPFPRIGDNTVLFSLDKHISECSNK